MSVDFTADQIRLLLTLTSEDWWRWENTKGFGDRRAADRQVELEGIQAKLRQALAKVEA